MNIVSGHPSQPLCVAILLLQLCCCRCCLPPLLLLPPASPPHRSGRRPSGLIPSELSQSATSPSPVLKAATMNALHLPLSTTLMPLATPSCSMSQACSRRPTTPSSPLPASNTAPGHFPAAPPSLTSSSSTTRHPTKRATSAAAPSSHPLPFPLCNFVEHYAHVRQVVA